ncbi:MAG: type VI secretion system protein TssA [Rhizobacter sp.]|nr:type VI secretion system protein TssA [Rhizobacter sp.]
MNIDALLMPVSESAPCGEDLSFSSEFDDIAEMRREDDPTLDQGEWVTALKLADWPGVRQRCGDLLVSRSKDLRLAMWWAEAATLTDGYAGLQQGLVLCTDLCDRFWDGLFPQAEGGDMEQRVGNIGWFLGRLGFLSTAVPVVKGRAGSYSLRQMQMARAQQPAPDNAPAAGGDGLSLDKVNRALRETPKDALRQTLSSIEACQQALQAWQTVVDGKLGVEGPSFAPAREALGAALHEVQRLAREVGALSSASAPAGAAQAVADADASPAARPAGGPLRTREQALAQLREVAAFFRTTEPHSPVAYLADKAVHWGEMPLHLWLRSVVKDAAALAHVEELLGLEAPRGDTPA